MRAPHLIREVFSTRRHRTHRVDGKHSAHGTPADTQARPENQSTGGDPTRAQAWAEFRSDLELLDRLRVTPNELEALEKCALLGTLTCKGDLLFVLRQIREATRAETEPQPFHTSATPQPSSAKPLVAGRSFGRRRRRGAAHASANGVPQLSSPLRTLRLWDHEQYAAVLCALVLAAGLLSALFAGICRLAAVAGVGSLGASPVRVAAGNSGGYGRLGTLLIAEVYCVAALVMAHNFGGVKTWWRFRKYQKNSRARSWRRASG